VEAKQFKIFLFIHLIFSLTRNQICREEKKSKIKKL